MEYSKHSLLIRNKYTDVQAAMLIFSFNEIEYMFYCYKIYNNFKFTTLKFSDACKANERKRVFGAGKRGDIPVETRRQIFL